MFNFLKAIVRKALPSSVSGGNEVNVAFDNQGRSIIWPYQIREAATTALATLTTGTSTALLVAGGTEIYNDLVHVTFCNNSTATAMVALLDDGTTVKNIQVPAGSTLSLDLPYPLLQQAKNSQWNVDMEDITGTTVYVCAAFVKNV